MARTLMILGSSRRVASTSRGIQSSVSMIQKAGFSPRAAGNPHHRDIDAVPGQNPRYLADHPRPVVLPDDERARLGGIFRLEAVDWSG